MIEFLDGLDKFLNPLREKAHHGDCMFYENGQCDCILLRELDEEEAAELKKDAGS